MDELKKGFNTESTEVQNSQGTEDAEKKEKEGPEKEALKKDRDKC
jgi:hypothetical protein